MPIDWFTVVAQALNFLILVWLLKRFLYKPILHAIDQREKGIATQLAEAEAKKTEAQRERDDFQRKSEAFDQERLALLKKATDDANGERQRLLDVARKDADSLLAKRRDALQNEQRSLSQEIARRTQKEVFSITRKALTDLANMSIEGCMCEAFVARLRASTGAARDKLATALQASTHPVRVRSAFDLPPAERSAIETALKETIATGLPVQFETAPEVVSGIELSANGQKVAWSIADYLTTLEKNVSELLQDDATPESPSNAPTKPETSVPSRAVPIGVAISDRKVVPKPTQERQSQYKIEAAPSTTKRAQ